MSTARESLPNEIHGLEERRDLQLLKEVQRVMSDALNSLAGHSHKTKEEAYVWWASVAVNRAAEGFHCLRESGRADASKLLVRPTIELVFAAEAVIRQRGFWFSKAYSEWLED